MSLDNTQKIIQLLQEQLRWTKVVSSQQVKTILSTALQDESDRAIYQLTDGNRSIRDIERITRISRSKIWKLWAKWETTGLAERITISGTNRIKRSFSLDNFGIELPNLPELSELQGQESDMQ